MAAVSGDRGIRGLSQSVSGFSWWRVIGVARLGMCTIGTFSTFGSDRETFLGWFSCGSALLWTSGERAHVATGRLTMETLVVSRSMPTKYAFPELQQYFAVPEICSQ